MTRYVTPWLLLNEAVKWMIDAGYAEDPAKRHVCQAIADGSLSIRLHVGRNATSRFTASGKVVGGKDVDIPSSLTPEQMDWNNSRPLPAWPVRVIRRCGSDMWHFDRIEVSAVEIRTVFGVQDPRHQGSRDSTLVGGTSSVAPRLPIAGSTRRRGPKPTKRTRTQEAMKADFQHGRISVVELQDMLEKELAARYGVSRDVARKARNAVLSEFGPSKPTLTNE